MAITASNTLRDVKIKTGIVTRFALEKCATNGIRFEKELVSYRKELITQEQRIEKMKADSEKDEWDVKKQVHFIAASANLKRWKC